MPLSVPALLAIGLGLALLVLLPARRLEAAGLSGRSIGTYALAVWSLAFLVAIRPGATRFLLPILLIAYLAPFVASPDRIARVVRRGGRLPPKPPLKNVTPPEDGVDGGPTGQP